MTVRKRLEDAEKDLAMIVHHLEIIGSALNRMVEVVERVEHTAQTILSPLVWVAKRITPTT